MFFEEEEENWEEEKEEEDWKDYEKEDWQNNGKEKRKEERKERKRQTRMTNQAFHFPFFSFFDTNSRVKEYGSEDNYNARRKK